MKNYVIVKEVPFPLDSTVSYLRKLDDEFWKNYILNYLLQYYKNVNNNYIQDIISKELEKKKADIEKQIKNNIKIWFRKNKVFCYYGFKLDQEPLSESNQESYYDLKFQHSFWNKYFPFECKNLGKIKRISLNKSAKEYVYTKMKNREDGGMHRYMIGKYSAEQDFGGMIGFIISKSEQSIKELLYDKIVEIYDKEVNGKLIEEKIIENSINGNENTFNTIHYRSAINSNKNEKIILHHILMDFTI